VITQDPEHEGANDLYSFMEKAEMGGVEISIAKQVQVYYVSSTFHF